MNTRFTRGDVVECRDARKSAIAARSREYVKVRIAEIKDKEGSKASFLVETTFADSFSPAEEKFEVLGSDILPLGESKRIWDDILAILKGHANSGHAVDKTLRGYIGDQHCFIDQFIKALKEMQPQWPIPPKEDMLQIFWQQDLLNSTNEFISWEKLISNPSLAAYFQLLGDETNLHSDESHTFMEARHKLVHNVFESVSPLVVSDVPKLLQKLKNNTMTTSEYSAVTESTSSLSPRQICSFDLFEELLRLANVSNEQLSKLQTQRKAPKKNAQTITKQQKKKLKQPMLPTNEMQDISDDLVDRLVKDMLTAVRLALEHQIDFRILFESFDLKFDDFIPVDNFAQVMASLGVRNLTPATLSYIINKRSPQSLVDGKIMYRKFLISLAPDVWKDGSRDDKEQDRDNCMSLAALERLRYTIQSGIEKGKVQPENAFGHFDKDGDGLIDRKEFAAGIAKLGTVLKTRQVHMLMDMFESTEHLQQQKINFQSFYNAVIQRPAVLLQVQNAAFFPSRNPPYPKFEQILRETSEVFANARRDGLNVRALLEVIDSSDQCRLPIEHYVELLLELGFDLSRVDRDEVQAIKVIEQAYGTLHKDIIMQHTVKYSLLLALLCPDVWLDSLEPSEENEVAESTFDHLVDIIANALAENVPAETCFKVFDETNDNLMSTIELRNALIKLGFPITISFRTTQMIMKKFQGPQVGLIEKNAFQKAIEDRLELRAKFRGSLAYAQGRLKHVREAFEKYDASKKGLISLSDALKALASLDLVYSVEDLKKAIGYRLLHKVKKETFVKYHFLFHEISQGNGNLPIDMLQHVKTFGPPSPMVPGSSRVLMQESKLMSPTSSRSVIPGTSREEKLVDSTEKILDHLRELVQAAANHPKHPVSVIDSFAHFDLDGDGLIKPDEFKYGLERLINTKLSDQQNNLLMKYFQVPGRNFIDIGQFQKVMGTSPSSFDDLGKVQIKDFLANLRTVLRDAQARGSNDRSCFRLFDNDNTGSIGMAKLEAGLLRLNMHFSQQQLKSIMREYGVAHLDGNIDYTSFLRMIGVEEEQAALLRIIKRIRLGLARSHEYRSDVMSPKTAHIEAKVDGKVSSAFSIKSLFMKADYRQDGVIDRVEFLQVLRKLDLKLQEQDFEKLVRYLDANNDGLVDYEEFVKQVEPAEVATALRSAVQKAQLQVARRRLDRHAVMNPFQHFDLDQSNTITQRDFRCAMTALGIRLDPSEMKQLLDVLNLQNDGKIHYLEFIQAAIVRKSHQSQRHGGNGPGGQGPMSPMSPGSPSMELRDTVIDDPIATLEADLQEFIASAESMNIPLKETFRYFDTNGDGSVTWEEFHRALMELGFECSEMQLRQLMSRVNGGIPWHGGDTARSTSSNRNQHIDYNAFLRYWSAAKNPEVPVSKDARSDEEIVQQVRKLRRELKSFLLESGKRGVKASDVFSHFDMDNNGTISLEEFELAISDIFAHHEEFDARVIRQFTETLDESKDGQVDYFEFLGIKRSAIPGLTLNKNAEAKRQTWQAVFGSRQSEKTRRAAKSVARYAVEAILCKVESEIETHGPLWQAQRRAHAARVNNASFIQRNATAVKEKVYCARKARVIVPKFVQETSNQAVGTAVSPSNSSIEEFRGSSSNSRQNISTSTSAKSMEKRLRIAKRIHAAEMAAARMAEEAALRAEEAAEAQRLRNVEENATRHALGRLNNVMFFSTQSRVLDFLESIGLTRFQSRISHGTHLGMTECYVFPLGNDHDMLTVLGTGSTIVARKVKRELLRLLSVDALDPGLVAGDGDPEEWTVKQVSKFASACGLPSLPFEHQGIDGEALLELDLMEALEELRLENEIALQALLFRTAYLHYSARSRHGNANTHITSATHNHRVYRRLVVNDTMLPRPNEAPINQWGTSDVVQLMSSLELPIEEAMALALDGETLLELSDEEIEQELRIRGPLLTKFRAAIEAVRQPPWLALGTGPYFEARLAAPTTGDPDPAVMQSNELSCTYLKAARQHDIWLHVGPALSDAFQVVLRGLNLDENAEKLPAKASGGFITDKPEDFQALSPSGRTKVSAGAIEAELARVMDFLRQAARSGLPVLETFRSRDETNDDTLTLFEFEESLFALGYDSADVGLLRLTLQSRIKDSRRKSSVNYKRFYIECMNRAEFHHPVFSKALSSTHMAFTANGFMASLLVNLQGQTTDLSENIPSLPGPRELGVHSNVLVRYGGGATLYEASILCDHKDGSYDVRFENTGEIRSIPLDWIEEVPIQNESSERGRTTPKGVSGSVTKFSDTKIPTNFQLARCDSSFDGGIHVWRVFVKHMSHDVVVGIASVDRSGRDQFVGVNSRGELICRGYSASRVRSMNRFARISKNGFGVGDALLLRLDLTSQELQIFLAPDTIEVDQCIDDLTEVARIRLNEVYRAQGKEQQDPNRRIKMFLKKKRGQLEKLLLQKIDERQRSVPVSVISYELYELGLEARESDLFNFLQPFLHRRRHGVDPLAMLEGLGLASEQHWESDSGSDSDYDEKNLIGPNKSITACSGYAPGMLLQGAGDAVQFTEACRAAPAMAEAKVGALVEVRYGGGSLWYPGEIMKIEENRGDHAQTSYTIRYDDGEVESGVRMGNIRILRQEKPPVATPKSRLVLQLYCRLLAYVAPISNNQREERLAQRRAQLLNGAAYKSAAKGRVWQHGRHHEFEIEKGSQEGEKRAAERISGSEPTLLATDVEIRGSTFSDVGGLRLQELLRKRLNTPHQVNWSLTTSTCHQFYAPLAVEQQSNETDASTKGTSAETVSSFPGAVVSDQSWTHIGSIDVESMQKVSEGEVGIPVSLRLDAPSNQCYYRLCFMGVLGTVLPSGEFVKVQAPVEPVRAVMNKTRVRIGGGWEMDVFDSLAMNDSADFKAGRFFLLSGAIAVHEPTKSEQDASKARTTNQKRTPKGLPKRVSRKPFREEFHPERRRGNGTKLEKEIPTVEIPGMGDARLSNVDTVEDSTATKPNGVAYLNQGYSRSNRESSMDDSPKRASPAPRSPSRRRFGNWPKSPTKMWMSQDEQIVIDRWLKDIGLNEYGLPPDLDEVNFGYENSGRFSNRFEQIFDIHPERPWMQMARERRWLPTRDEQRKIRRWARRSGSQRPNRRLPDQTLYEALLLAEPSQPWLDRVPRRDPLKPRATAAGLRASTNVDIGKEKRDAEGVFKGNEGKQFAKGGVNKPHQPAPPATPRQKGGKQNKEWQQDVRIVQDNIKRRLEEVDQDVEHMTSQYASLVADHDRTDSQRRIHRDEVKEMARAMAQEAMAQKNEEAHLAWERKQQLLQAQSLAAQQASVDRREANLRTMEDQFRAAAQAQEWAQQIDKKYVRKVAKDKNRKQGEDGPLERAVHLSGKNIPL